MQPAVISGRYRAVMVLLLASACGPGCRPGGSPNADRACNTDADCPKDRVCTGGRCQVPADAGGAQAVRKPAAGPDHTPRLRWDLPLGAVISARAAVAAGPGGAATAFVGTHAGRLVAVPLEGEAAGSLAWETYLDGILWSSPAPGPSGEILVGGDDDALVAVSATDGRVLWRRRLGDCDPPRAPGPEGTRCDVDGGPTVLPDGDVLVGADGVYRLGPGGEVRWRFPADRSVSARHVFSTPMPAGELIVWGGQDGAITAATAAGEPRWRIEIGGDVDGTAAVDATGTIYIGSDDGRVHAIDPAGSVRWTFQTGRDIRSAAAIGPDGTIHVASFDGSLYALGPDGKLRWRFTTGGPIAAAPTIDRDGRIYVGSQDDRLYAIRPDGTRAWALEFPADIDAPVAIGPDGVLVVGCDDGHLRALGG